MTYQLNHIIRPSKLKHVSLPVHVSNTKSAPNPYFSEPQDFFNSDLVAFKIKVGKCFVNMTKLFMTVNEGEKHNIVVNIKQ